MGDDRQHGRGWWVVALVCASAGCPAPVVIPAPGVDKTAPTITASVDTRAMSAQHSATVDFSGPIFLYPPLPGGFPVQVVATDPGGMSKVQLFDCFTCASRKLLKEVTGDRDHPGDRLLLLFNFTIQNKEQHQLGIVAEDFSGNRAEKGPVAIVATAVPSDVFPADNTAVGMRSITGTLAGTPGYNPGDPDFHYFFVPDNEFSDAADTLGSDTIAAGDLGATTQGGEIHPEQDGWVVELNQAGPALNDSDRQKWMSKGPDAFGHIPAPAGWIPMNLPPGTVTPGVVWAWDPARDTLGNTLAAGDHVRVTGRLRYDHEDRVKPCWDSGSTAAAYESKSARQGHSQGHAEIHPVDLIEKIPPLDSSAQTIVWESACVASGLSANRSILDTDLEPVAPRPVGAIVDVQEVLDTSFTNTTSITHHSLTLASGGARVRLHVQVDSQGAFGAAGKFRGKYTLRWLSSGQAHIVNGCPSCPP